MRAYNFTLLPRWLPVAMAGLGLPAIFLVSPAHAASFDCQQATTPVETTICNDARLSQLDAEMGRALDAALDRFPSAKDQLLSEQRAWLSLRDSICSASDVACLRSMTQQRLHALSLLRDMEAPGAQRSNAAEWSGIPAAVLEAHRSESECEEPSSERLREIEPITAQLDATTELYAIPCVPAAYQTSYRLYVRERSQTGETGRIKTLYFATYTNTHHWQGTDLLFNISVEGGKLTAFMKFRGLGDCGRKGWWTWIDHGYRLDRYKYQEECRGIMSEDWPVVFPPRP
jgi:uncharacterized protein